MDFILLSWRGHEFPVFNVADMAVTCGVTLFALVWTRDHDARPRRRAPRHRTRDAAADEAESHESQRVDLTVPERAAGQRVDRWLAKARIGLVA